MSNPTSINKNSTTLNLVAGGAYIITGSNDTIIAGTGVTVTVTGSGDTVTAGAGSSVTIGGNGQNATQANSDSVTLANGGSVYEYDNSHVTIGGNNITANVGNLDGTGMYGSGDTFNVNGTGSYVVIGGNGQNASQPNWDSVNFTDAPGGTVYEYDSSSLTVNGSSVTAWVGTNSTTTLTGAGDAATVAASATGTSVNLTGSGEYATISGSGDFGNALGTNDTVTVTGAYSTANAFASTTGTSLNLMATGDVANVAGSGNFGNAAGANDTVTVTGAYSTANAFASTTGTSLNLMAAGDVANVAGSGNFGNAAGANDTVTVTGAYSTANAFASATNAALDLAGSGDSASMARSGDTATITGGYDTVNAVAGDTANVSGTGETVNGSYDTVNETAAGTSVLVNGNSDTVNSSAAGNVAGFTGSNDIANVSNGQIYTNDTSAGSLSITDPGEDDTTTNISGTTQSSPALTAQTISDIDAIDNAVLDRDAAPADLVSAQIVLADGGNLATVMSAVANSAESQADMASTYAAATASGPIQTLMNAQPQSNFEAASGGCAPTQTQFNAFADAMSTSDGAPIELVSIDPYTGAQTELADTSMTNLLAELPVLQTLANGATPGLQLADGTQVRFASTAQTVTFLYSLAVQQMQATSFVTDNYNLDMQWLNTVDQPLLSEALFWSERSAAETPAGTASGTRAQEDNVLAALALKIAAEPPGSRQDMSVTINNTIEHCQTQITVYANGSGGRIHDIASSPWTIVEQVVSTVVNVAAVFFPALAPVAVAIDAAQAGQAFANGQDIQGLLSLAQAVGAGLGAAAGAIGDSAALAAEGGVVGDAEANALADQIELASNLQTASQMVNAATQVVGGAYGAVTSAQNGNAFGVLAGVLEVAAGAASGIGASSGDTAYQQAMATLAKDIGTAGVAASMAGAFTSGNVTQGLLDSLNLFLPAVAQAYISTQTNQTDASAGLGAASQAVNNAYQQYYANQNAPTSADNIAEGLAAAIPAPTIGSGSTGTAAPQYNFKINTAAFAADLGAITANGVPTFNNAISQLPAAAVPPGGYTTITTFDSTTWQFTFAADPAVGGGTGSNIGVNVQPVNGNNSTPSTISAALWGIADNTIWFMNQLFGVSSAEAAGNGTPLHSVVVQNPDQYVGAPLFVHNGDTQCVALPEEVSLAAGTPVGGTSGWHMGDAVTQATPAGTIIAIFGAGGVYTNTPGSSHTAIVLGPDGNGGMWVAEQYQSSQSVLKTDYTSGNSSFEKNLDSYHAVLVH